MNDLDEARTLFLKQGLAFPSLPPELASSLRKHRDWLYSTRPIEMSPYNMDYYVREHYPGDYAVLAHDGHGVNSWAIQYFLVFRDLRMFLSLSWGGAYMDNDRAVQTIRECFALADRITAIVAEKRLISPLNIAVSDYDGSFWQAVESPDGTLGDVDYSDSKRPQEVLEEALSWLLELHGK